MTYLLLIPIFFPLISGLIIKLIKWKKPIRWKIVSLVITVITTILVWLSLIFIKEEALTLISFTSSIQIKLKLDSLGKIFAGMVSLLWPFALLYSFAYMEDEERKEEYNMFYIMTFGVVLGIAFAGNLFTMFIFYEILTLITLPLIIHPLTKEAKKAGNYYLYFSLSGSVLALIGLIIITITAGNSDFILGGILNSKLSYAYLISFLGFGVKAAIFPFSFWLPMASAAPTPTTALLHAVAVVKAGVFAIMRITYYNFNYTLLQNTWVQYVVMMLSAFTIIFGSTVALKEQHFKRRLAYSTISNLSYILLGVTLFSKSGLIAAILHFIFHSITKICLFFACGAIIKNSSAHYVFELNSLGKKMPLTFTFFTIASLSLTGIPLFAGFISKWYLINASITNGSVFAYIGSGSLILSALLTAIYTLSISLRGFLYPVNPKYEQIYQQAHEPNLIYLITIGVFALACVVFGIFSNSFIGMIENMFGGLL